MRDTTQLGLLLAGLLTAFSGAYASSYAYRVPSKGLTALAGVTSAQPPAAANCSLPWGGTLADGATYAGVAYSASVAWAPGTCEALVVAETCSNGVLSYPSAATACVVKDPMSSSVTTLLHFDDWTDATGRHTLTAAGTPTIATSGQKMGTGALSLNGSSRLSSPNSADFRFGTADFTVEFWMNSAVAWTSQPSSAGIVGQKESDVTYGWVIYRDGNYPSKLNARVADMGYCISGSTPTTGVWEHWAVTRQGTTVRWFKDGALDATCSIPASSSVTDTTGLFYVGYSQTWGGYLKGGLDDLRITTGVARYTKAFTPPTAPYPYP